MTGENMRTIGTRVSGVLTSGPRQWQWAWALKPRSTYVEFVQTTSLFGQEFLRWRWRPLSLCKTSCLHLSHLTVWNGHCALCSSSSGILRSASHPSKGQCFLVNLQVCRCAVTSAREPIKRHSLALTFPVRTETCALGQWNLKRVSTKLRRVIGDLQLTGLIVFWSCFGGGVC